MPPRRTPIDLLSVLLSSAGLVAIVYGMLQSKTWGWIQPLQSPEIGGVPIAPLGVSLTAWLILAGCMLVAWFFHRQRRLIEAGWPTDTPVSVVSRAGWPDQLQSDHTVATLPRASLLHAGRPTVVTVGAGAKAVIPIKRPTDIDASETRVETLGT